MKKCSDPHVSSPLLLQEDMAADEQKLEQPIKVQLSDDEDAAVVQTERAPKVATKVRHVYRGIYYAKYYVVG